MKSGYRIGSCDLTLQIHGVVCIRGIEGVAKRNPDQAVTNGKFIIHDAIDAVQVPLIFRIFPLKDMRYQRF